MFARQNYINIGLYAKAEGEVTKNIYTLYFLQRRLLDQEEKKKRQERAEAAKLEAAEQLRAEEAPMKKSKSPAKPKSSLLARKSTLVR